MSEMARIIRLLKQTFEGKPYYGPSVLSSLAGATADLAARKPPGSAHSIWEIVAHLNQELIYACAVVQSTAGPWIEGKTTWPAITNTSDTAWQEALEDLKKANQALVLAVKQLDDAILDREAHRVRVPFYLMLHGTIQHNVYHAGQISLLRGQMVPSNTKKLESEDHTESRRTTGVRWVAIFDDNEGLESIRREHSAAHFDYLAANRDKIVIAGGLRLAPSEWYCGGLWVLQVDSRDEAVSLIEQDPYFRLGLRQGYRLLAWGKAPCYGMVSL